MPTRTVHVAESLIGGRRVPAGWGVALLVVALVTLVRLAFVAVSPVGLAADEAQYWDWSRTPALSYYSKGPGIAWLIALGTSILGDTELGVRLFAPLSGAATALLVGASARLAYPRTRHVAAYGAVAAALCLPIFHGLGLIMTIDPPYLTSWAAAVLIALVVSRELSEGRAAGGVGAWGPEESARRAPRARLLLLGAALGLALGVGFLFKYTSVVLLASLAIYAWFDRRRLVDRAGLAVASAGCVGAFVAATSPVVLWNAANDWPTVRHLLGHLGLPGGDTLSEGGRAVANDGLLETLTAAPMNAGLYVAGQLALAGPFLVLASLASLSALWRVRTDRDVAASSNRWESRPLGARPDLLLLCAGWTIFLMYLGVAFFTEPEGNWPVAGYLALIVIAARELAVGLPERAERLRAWKAGGRRERAGIVSRKPESPVQLLWHWSLAYGLLAFVGALVIVPADRLPIVGDLIPLHRLNRGMHLAAAVEPVRDELREQAGAEPLIIAERYTTAAWLSFYLPGQPRVSSGASYRGDRQSAYDYFFDRRLDNAALVGRPAVVVGGRVESWDALRFDGLRRVLDAPKPVYVARRFLGPASAHSEPRDGGPRPASQ